MVLVQRHLQTCSLSPAQKRPPEGRVRTRIQSAFHSPHYVPLGKMQHRVQGPTSSIFVGRGESSAKMVSGSPQLPLLGPDHPRREGQRGSFCRCWRNAMKRMLSRSTRTQRDVSSLPWPLLRHRQTDRYAHPTRYQHTGRHHPSEDPGHTIRHGRRLPVTPQTGVG